MTTFLKIDIWKKGTNRQTSMPDYQVDISEGDLHTVAEGISALMEISHELRKGAKK